jgi:hypothetical protein
MAEIARYQPFADRMMALSIGEWVLYADHAKIVAELQSTLSRTCIERDTAEQQARDAQASMAELEARLRQTQGHGIARYRITSNNPLALQILPSNDGAWMATDDVLAVVAELEAKLAQVQKPPVNYTRPSFYIEPEE